MLHSFVETGSYPFFKNLEILTGVPIILPIIGAVTQRGAFCFRKIRKTLKP